MITTLYPTVVLFPPSAPVAPSVASYYPIMIVYPEVVISNCPLPPQVTTFNYVNYGNEGSSNQINGYYFTSYQSQSASFTDIIGNYSSNSLTWTPALSGTDPPSHLIFSNKAFSFDCVFYPQINQYLGLFCMAWLESSPSGRVDLWYADAPAGHSMPITTTTSLTGGSNTIFIYPQQKNVNSGVKSQSIPLSDIVINDIQGNKFHIDTNEALVRGLEVTLPAPIYSFEFTQSFRNLTNNVIGQLTTIPTQATGFQTLPLSNITINIYYGTTRLLYMRVVTNDKGYYSFTASNMRYTFEVITDNLSINVNQRLL